MASRNGEAGQRGSAEAGLDVFCLAAEDNRVNATRHPAPQVANRGTSPPGWSWRIVSNARRARSSQGGAAMLNASAIRCHIQAFAAFEADHIRPEQDARFEADAWEEAIKTYLVGRRRVTVGEIAQGALHIETARLGTADQRRIAAVLHYLGWTRIRDWKGKGYVRAEQ